MQDSPRRHYALLVEDNATSQLFSCSILESSGWEVLAVKTGEDALVALNTNKVFDVVVLDLNLPGGINGFQTMERIREKLANLPIVILTSGSSGGKLACFAAGADCYLQKPVKKNVLLETLALAIRKRNDEKARELPWNCLIVCDDKEVAEPVCALLKEMHRNHWIHCVASSANALDIASVVELDLILMDVSVIGARACAREMREQQLVGGPLVVGLSCA